MRKLHLPYLQILEAAINIYAAEGPKGFTMRKIAGCLGIRASALYRHFTNKDAILDAVAAEAERRLGATLQYSRPKKRLRVSPAETLSMRALDYSVKHPQLFQLISRRQIHRAGPPAAGSRAAAWRDEVVCAMERGHLRQGDPESAGAALWAQVCGLVALRERGDLPLSEKGLRNAWYRSTKWVLLGLEPSIGGGARATGTAGTARQTCPPGTALPAAPP